MYFLSYLLLVLFLLTKCSSISDYIAESENISKKNAGFVFTIPKTVVSGKDEIVCISIHHISAPVNLLVTIEWKKKYFPTRKTLNAESSCFPLHIPSLKIVEPNFIKVQIQLNGISFSSHNEDPILIYPKSLNKTYIDTDRSFYKPGDKINIRILVVNNKFLPLSEKIPKVLIKNPLDVTVQLWENVNLRSGLVHLDYQLMQESLTGKWKIQVNDITKTIEVYKHILPKFKIDLQYPRFLYYASKSIKINVCAKYSFGKPVNGIGFIKITGMLDPVVRTDKLMNGCAQFSLSNEDLHLNYLNISRWGNFDQSNKNYLQIAATVTEQGTNKIHITSGKITIHNKPFTLKIVGKQTFQPGLPYKAKIQFNNINTNLSKELIEICYNVAIRKSWNQSTEACANFTINKDNSIDFAILPLKNNVVQMYLYARSLNHTFIGDSFLTMRLHSPSNSYIALEQVGGNTDCRITQRFSVTYTTDNIEKGENITFYYMVKTHEELYKSDKIVHKVRKTHPDYTQSLRNAIGGKTKHVKLTTGVDNFIITFTIDKKLVSKYQIIVYYITKNGETVAATKTAYIHPCSLPVEVKWSHNRTLPGASTTLNITTKGEAFCSVTSVDKSTTFLNNNHNLLQLSTFLKTISEERDSAQSGRITCVSHTRKSKALKRTENLFQFAQPSRRKRHTYDFAEDFDAYDVFNKFGTIVITNLNLITKPCYTGAVLYHNVAVQYMNEKYDDENDEQPDQIRHIFPETWLWDLIPVSNTLTIERQLPHTITNWVTNVLCVSETKGVGFSKELEITAFQPFFVHILTPYSIKRNESFYLYVNVFNYLSYNIPVKIMLSLSTGLKMSNPDDKNTVSFCAPKNNTKTYSFKINGTFIGVSNISVVAEIDNQYPDTCGPETVVSRRDVVFKSILIEPEGFPISKTQSALLCVSDSAVSNNITWTLNTPSNTVQNTDKAYININGDLLGQTIANLDDLLGIPTGCGEQTMATMAPNLYVLKYLNATKNLNPSIKQKIIRNLKKGYQNILNYVHKDGSFSAFGYHDPSGSMFLTVFVVRILQEAKNYIYVNQRVIDKAIAWIFHNQLENGCFNTMNHVFQDMGGASTENSTPALTSYVIISLIAANIEIPEQIQTNAKYCIRSQVNPDLYTSAISSYALFKLNWESEGVRNLNRLINVAQQHLNLMWWSNRDSNSTATDIEITSYVLLSLLENNSTANLAKAHSVVRWLMSKVGPKGGFKSTQDTVVTLDALTKYAILLNNQHLNVKVDIKAFNQLIEETITDKEKIKTKQITLKHTTNKVNVQVEGQGCVLIQLVLNYYVKQIPRSEAFRLSMNVESVSTIDKCSIASLIPCVAYTGLDIASNMAVLEINLPSGYQADRASLYKLVEQPASIKKFEEVDNQIILYITKLSKEQICINFNINENVLVEERKESTVKLYDYYKPEYENLQFYTVNACENVENLPMIETNKREEFDIAENTKKVKRNLNSQFVDRDVEMETPDGCEGAKVYVKINATNPNKHK